MNESTKSKIFNLALLIFISVCTFFYVPIKGPVIAEEGINFGYMAQELFFRYGVIAIFALSMTLKAERSFKSPVLAALLIYILFISIFKGYGLEARRSILNIFAGILFLKTVFEYFNLRYLKTAGLFFLAVIALNLLWCYFQYHGIDPLYSDIHAGRTGLWDSLVGLMKLKVHLGVMAVLIAPFLYMLNPFLVILAIPLLIISKSSVSAFAFAASLGLITFFRIRKTVFFIMSAALAIAAGWYIFKFDMPEGQFFERFRVWLATLSLTLKGDPWFGAGLGGFAKLSLMVQPKPDDVPQTWIWAHNEYIQLFYECGLAFIVFCGVFIAGLFKDFLLFRKDRLAQVMFSGVFSVVVISAIQFPFHLARLAVICIFIIAVFMARIHDLKEGAA